MPLSSWIFNYKYVSGLITIFILFACPPAYAYELSDYENCILFKLKDDNDNLSLKDLKIKCHKLNESTIYADEALGAKVHSTEDNNSKFKTFKFMAYKKNYILPFTYNYSGYDASLYQQQFNDSGIELDNTEAQFQISFKIPLLINIFDKNINLFASYTNKSFWQVYNSKLSSPFRETNHEPELWIQKASIMNTLGFTDVTSRFGVSHQSNGRGGLLSRSWNRIFADFSFKNEAIMFGVKTWVRIIEDVTKDDNPDITDYLGHGKIYALYKKNNHTVSLMSRNNLESNFTKGAVEIDWSFPISENNNLKGYIKVFSGYGESLIDYNHIVNTIGVGILISDWS